MDKWEHIDKGIIIYISFLQSAVAEDVSKIGKQKIKTRNEEKTRKRNKRINKIIKIKR